MIKNKTGERKRRNKEIEEGRRGEEARGEE